MKTKYYLAASLLCIASACSTAPGLRESDFQRVSSGMSQDEVRHAIGTPARSESFARQRQVAWDYPFTDSWGYFAVLSVIFDADGRVVGKTHTRIEPNDS